MLASLEVALWLHEIPSPVQLCQTPHFQSQVLIFVQSCNWIICQSSYTLENPQHNSSSKSFKLTSRVPRCIIPCQHIPWFFQRQNWTHTHQIFTIWFSWSVSFSTCPTSKADESNFIDIGVVTQKLSRPLYNGFKWKSRNHGIIKYPWMDCQAAVVHH